MYKVYIMQSVATGRYYIGSCKDLHKRFKQHNLGKVRSTKGYRPWKLVYSEAVVSNRIARQRELQIKSYKGGDAFRTLIHEIRVGTKAVKWGRL